VAGEGKKVKYVFANTAAEGKKVKTFTSEHFQVSNLINHVTLGQTKKIISFSGQFPKILMMQGGTFFLLL
jgi:hypothetical protein